MLPLKTLSLKHVFCSRLNLGTLASFRLTNDTFDTAHYSITRLVDQRQKESPTDIKMPAPLYALSKTLNQEKFTRVVLSSST